MKIFIAWLLGMCLVIAGFIYSVVNDPDRMCRQRGYLLSKVYKGHTYCYAPIPPPPEDAVRID